MATFGATVLVLSACSGDGADGADGADSTLAFDDEDQAVAAEVRGIPVFEDEVELLANDPGFQAYLNAPPPEGELSDSPVGWATLSWLVKVSMLEAELERRGVEVSDEHRATAEERVLSDEVDLNTADDVLHSVENPSPEVAEIMADGLAKYLALDEHLRSLDPADPAEADYLREHYPALVGQACGHAALVDTRDEAEAIELVEAGTSITELEARVDVIGRTDLGDPTCVTASGATSQIADLLREAPLGQVSTQRMFSPALQAHGAALVLVTERREAPGDLDPDPFEIAVQEMTESGVSAFSYIELRAAGPEIDEDWGEWRPSMGIVPVEADPSYRLIPGSLSFAEPPPTTAPTTGPPATAPPTTAPPTTAPPTTAPPTPTGLSPLLYAIPDPGPGDLVARSQAALDSSVSEAWRVTIPTALSIINGSTSLSNTNGSIQVGSFHASGEWDRLQAIMAHEFGHHVAFDYGTQAELGAAPAGWPPSGSPPVERWADCVSTSFTGNSLGSHGQTPCSGSSLDWTFDYLAQDPATFPRTG